MPEIVGKGDRGGKEPGGVKTLNDGKQEMVHAA